MQGREEKGVDESEEGDEEGKTGIVKIGKWMRIAISVDMNFLG